MVFPLVFSTGEMHAVTLATSAPGGFDDEVLGGVERALPALSVLVEREYGALVAETVSKVWIGPESGPKVLAGRARRGDIEHRDVVVGFCDMQDFTAFSVANDATVVVDRLNRYFEVVSREVVAGGGEVLRLIGDAALFVFPANQDGLSSARDTALRIVAALPEDILAGVALHPGEVAYGNIGAPDRLDFTVIGRAVNRASRIASLCRPLNENVLVSRLFAERCWGSFRDCGQYPVRGVAEPVSVFAPAS